MRKAALGRAAWFPGRKGALTPPGGGGPPAHPRTAGAVMSADAFGVAETLTVGDVIDQIRRRRHDGPPPHYVYVLDARSRPVGVLSMRDLVLSRPHAPASRVMRAPVATVGLDDDAEAVARLMRRHGHASLPVVDAAGALAGAVTADAVMAVIDREVTEEVQQMFGAGADEHLTSPWHFSFRKRLPWLFVNLALAILGASVVGHFEGTIGAWTVLAMYLPIVAGAGGNASAQAMAVAIRGIAVGEADRMPLRRVIARELCVGAASGLVTGAAAALVATVLHHEHGPLLACLVALSLFVNHVVACAWGAAIPFLMKALGFDPAQSATIFTTTLTDLVGFFTLLGLATASLNVLGG
jgi:magnesium transporter